MPALSDFSFDTSELREAFQLYEKATGKDAADILNRAAKNACIGGKGLKGALQLTKLASVASINRFDPNKEAKGKATKKRARLHFALQAKKGMKKGEGIKAAATKAHNRRISARSYSKAIWGRLAVDFGAVLRGKFDIKGPKGEPAKAGPSPVAKLDSGSLETSHVTDIMADALQQGVKNAAADMKKYALEKMQKTADQYSAR